MDRKKGKWGKIWLCIFIGCCIQGAVYFLSAKLFKSEGMEYRSWIRIAETVIFVFILPFSGMMALFFSNREKRMGQTKKGCVPSASGFWTFCRIMLYLAGTAEMILGFLIILVLGSGTFEKERSIGRDVILGTTRMFLDSSIEGSYYRAYGMLLKKEYKYYEEPVIVAVLEQRYEKRIKAVECHMEERENGTSYYVYELEIEGEKDSRFHGVPMPGMMPGYRDDCKEMRAITRGKEYARKNGIERFVETEDGEYSALKRPGIICSGREDMEECAKETSKIIDYLLEDSFFQDKGLVIPILCGGEEGEKTVRLEIGDVFGKKQEKEDIYQTLKEAYDRWARETAEGTRKEEPEKKNEESGRQEEKEERTAMLDQDGLLTPEGAYEKLYQTVFEPEGDRYECLYNAKGNFYAVLGEEEETKEGERLQTRRTVVYDRISRNNKCQLFVYYKEYYGEDGSDRGTLILNFYAVDRSTGEVTAGEKTAWAETASERYQKATGEK